MMQIIEQTHDETVSMYVKECSKKQLAEMLANCNEILRSRPIEFMIMPADQKSIQSNI